MRPGLPVVAGLAAVLAGAALIAAFPERSALRVPAALAVTLGLLLLILGLSRRLYEGRGARGLGRLLLGSHAWTGDEVVLDLGRPPGALATAMRPLLPRGRAEAAVAGPLALPDEGFDVVAMQDALGPMAAPARALALSEALRVLKPGGTLLLADQVPWAPLRDTLTARGIAPPEPVPAFRAALAPFWRVTLRRPQG
jgi:SAM-dependent methyltransferase